MTYRWLPSSFVGASVLSLMLAGAGVSTAHAQTAPRWDGDYRYTSYADYAFQNGYRLGAREGERDARDNKAYGFKRDDAYEDADWGFRGGDKDLYRRDFRRGYEEGYAAGYRHNAPAAWDNSGIYESRPPVVVAPPPTTSSNYTIAYATPYGRFAYDNGFRDGMDEGRKDIRDHKAFEFWKRDRFNDADHGYDRKFGPKDAYKADYRVGFRAGYEQGYHDGERFYDR